MTTPREGTNKMGQHNDFTGDDHLFIWCERKDGEVRAFPAIISRAIPRMVFYLPSLGWEPTRAERVMGSGPRKGQRIPLGFDGNPL